MSVATLLCSFGVSLILIPRDKRLLECKPMYVPLINYQLSLTLCTDCLRVICV